MSWEEHLDYLREIHTQQQCRDKVMDDKRTKGELKNIYRYIVIYTDYWVMATYCCYASTDEEAINKADNHFREKNLGWVTRYDPCAKNIDKLYGEEMHTYKWADGSEYVGKIQ